MTKILFILLLFFAISSAEKDPLERVRGEFNLKNQPTQYEASASGYLLQYGVALLGTGVGIASGYGAWFLSEQLFGENIGTYLFGASAISAGFVLGPNFAVVSLGDSQGRDGGYGGAFIGFGVGLVAGVPLGLVTRGLSVLLLPSLGSVIGYNLSASSVDVGGVKVKKMENESVVAYQLIQWTGHF